MKKSRVNNPDDPVIRRLQYRLQRQGMLELDTWLFPLISAVNSKYADAKVLAAIEHLIECEAPELLAMHDGHRPIPEELKPWLSI